VSLETEPGHPGAPVPPALHASRNVISAQGDQTVINFERVDGPVTQVIGQLPRPVTGIRSHAAEVAGLSGLRRNLTGAFLTYVPPPGNAPTHPDRLLERLTGPGGKDGVLLVGVAGVGKTRTCFEVGTRAEAAGWSVLHVVPGEPHVTTDQLKDAIATAGARVLVIIDYLNECQGLDLLALRTQVLPDARAAGKQVAVLASARPGWHELAATDASPLLATLPLLNDPSHSAQIQEQIISSLAPSAQAVLGMATLRELCGLRPVIALLIALEAEEQAARGLLDPTLSGIRPEELIGWLGRRLAEDGLTPPRPRDLFHDDEPDPILQSMTAMLTACPQAQAPVTDVGAAVLAAAAGRDGVALDTDDARHYLAILQTMGWVVTLPDGSLAAVHDIVTDQFLERVLLRPVSWRVRSGVAERVLAASLGRARTLGRYAVNLTRVVRDLDLADRGEQLRGFCEQWLTRQSGTAGQTLRSYADEGAYALGAILDSPFWSTVAFEYWQSVVAPWLSRFGETIFARHVLYRGLRAVQAPQAVGLVTEALQWLRIHEVAPEASFVISPLLRCHDLADEQAPAAIRHAFGWLAAHGAELQAEFVLKALLERDDLDSEQAQAAIGHALGWLAAHGAELQAEFVLYALLERGDLDSEQAQAAIRHGLGWLTDHVALQEASFVVGPLLRRQDLAAEQAPVVIGHALGWLAAYGTSLQAQFVLYALLERRDLDGDQAPAAIGHAFDWLRRHAATHDARFVIPPLLSRQDLAHEQAAAAVAHAFDYLLAQGTTHQADYTLKALFQRDDLNGQQAPAAIAHAFGWLASHGAAPQAEFVLRALLERDDLDSELAGAAIGHAFGWLRQHAATQTAGFVISPLLNRQDLAAEQAAAAVAHAFDYLLAQGIGPQADFVLKALLYRADLNSEQACAAVRYALDWLASQGTAPQVDFVLRALLERHDLNGEQVQAALAHALDWLAAHGTATQAGFVLRALFQRDDLDAEQIATTVQQALSWLAAHGTSPDAAFVLGSLLGRQGLGRESAEAAARCGVDWLSQHDVALEAAYVIRRLLERSLPDDLTASTVQHARNWLACYEMALDAGFVLPPLITRLGKGQLDEDLRQMADRWMTAYADDEGVIFIAKALSRHAPLTEQVAAAVIHAVLANPRKMLGFLGLIPVIFEAWERHIRTLPPEPALTVASEIDKLIDLCARSGEYRLGTPAARLDDVLMNWLDRPEALNDQCSSNTHYTALVTRALALIYSGRYAPAERDALLSRLRGWLDHWRCAPAHRTEALAQISWAERWAAGDPTTEPPGWHRKPGPFGEVIPGRET